MPFQGIQPGRYNEEYFAGSQVALFIGDIWVDEVTSISYQVQQSRSPIYGYASRLFDAVSEGQVLVTGTFTINFKEAGYLWLVLQEYKKKNRFLYKNSQIDLEPLNPFSDSPKDQVLQENIERIIKGDISTFEKNRALQAMARSAAQDEFGRLRINQGSEALRQATSASLGGFPDVARLLAQPKESVGKAEDTFENFENEVWRNDAEELDNMDRRADDPQLNPFDIYISYGDFLGSNYENHTIQRLRDVHIVGQSKQIVISGEPIMEQYSFLAKNLV